MKSVWEGAYACIRMYVPKICSVQPSHCVMSYQNRNEICELLRSPAHTLEAQLHMAPKAKCQMALTIYRSNTIDHLDIYYTCFKVVHLHEKANFKYHT